VESTRGRIDQAQHEVVRERLEAHLEDWLGGVSLSVSEGDAEEISAEVGALPVRIDILVVAPSPAFDHHLLVTSGLSVWAQGSEAQGRRFELCLSLPNDWPLGDEAFREDRWWWPLFLLRFWGRRSLVPGGAIGPWHTFGNGEPPAPFLDGWSLVGAVAAPAVFLGEALDGFARVEGEPEIELLQMIPLTADELSRCRARGSADTVRQMALRQPPPLGLVAPDRASLLGTRET
jgi:hypothetical protein